MGGLAGIVQYDTRDTIFTPASGLFAKATLRRFDERLGSSENFWRYGVKGFYFKSLVKKFTIGLRLEGEAVTKSNGDRIPFFANPFISMHGISAMRYQGEKMLLSELQVRYEVIPRWNIIVFGVATKVFGKETVFNLSSAPIEINTNFADAQLHPAGGLGFRYEVAQKFGLWGGLDFATSEDQDIVMYITIGSAWGAF